MYLVTGATGNVGRELVDVLVARGLPVRALTRRPGTADLPPGVERAAGSTSDTEAMTRALSGVEGVFLNPAGDLAGDPAPLLQALGSSSVRRVVLISSVGVTHDGLALAAAQRDVEDRVRAVRGDVVALRANQFMSNTLWWTPMLRAGRVAAPFADVALPAVDPADIADVAAEALTRDDLAGRDPVLTGAESTTPRERVAILADVLGCRLAFDELSEQEFRAANADVPADHLEYLIAMTGSPTAADQAISPDVRTITGHAPRAFAQWAARHRDRLLSS